jgi:folate-binding protein YgfZ
MNPTQNMKFIHLTDWDIIRVEGPDTKGFLENLLTSSVSSLDSGSGQLSGFCSPKGRLMASFWITEQSQNAVLIWISKDLAPEFAKKLQMYRLRSKVEIHYEPNFYSVYGVLSSSKEQAEINSEAFLFLKLPEVLHESHQIARTVVAFQQPPLSIDNELTEQWNLLEVLSGIPRLTSATKDLFVPQMINFESLGGVDFKKGCYPGQEVVARSQYRGTIKRRLKLGTIMDNSQARFKPGDLVFTDQELDQPAGVILLSAYHAGLAVNYVQMEINLSATGLPLRIIRSDEAPSNLIQMIEPPYQLLTI